MTADGSAARARKAEAALEAASQNASPFSKTLSLLGLGGDDKPSDAPAPKAATPVKKAAPKKSPTKPIQKAAPKKKVAPAPKKKAAPAPKKAPAGVPTINKWRKNRDGSITGLISGSSSFSENEKVTTSPIAQGDIASGEVVRTGSGSRYFLA